MDKLYQIGDVEIELELDRPYWDYGLPLGGGSKRLFQVPLDGFLSKLESGAFGVNDSRTREYLESLGRWDNRILQIQAERAFIDEGANLIPSAPDFFYQCRPEILSELRRTGLCAKTLVSEIFGN